MEGREFVAEPDWVVGVRITLLILLLRGTINNQICKSLILMFIYRWKRDSKTGDKVIHSKSGKAILGFVAIKRGDTGHWAIPGVSNYHCNNAE